MPKVNKLISSQKCQRCRHDKQKCVPEGRQWPGRRCDRCIKYDYGCSANRTRSEEQSGGKEADLLVTPTPPPTPTSEPTVSQLLQEIGDLHIMEDIDVEGLIPYSTQMNSRLQDRLGTVVSLLQGRAKQLMLEGNYIDAEHVYTHILGSSKLLQSAELSLEFLPNLVSIYEKTGNLSAAEAAQEILLCLAIESDAYSEDEVTLEAKKLSRLYDLFYHRIRNIAVEHDNDEHVGAEFFRLIVFCRVIKLDYRSSQRLKWMIEIPSKALEFAITAGTTLLTSLLLIHGGCDVNTTNEDGNTALHLAVRECQAEIVQSLLNKGVDLEVVNEKGDTALLLALYQTSEEAFNIAKALLDRGSAANVTDRGGRSTLHLAARNGDPDLTERLLSYSLEVDAPDFNGSTPLMIAAARWDSSNCVPMAQHLLKSGANVDAITKQNRTPLMYASGYGSIEMVRLLIARGANVESRDSFNRTALHRALERTTGTEEEVISTLIEAHIDIEAKDDDGRSALGVALKRGDTAIARQLLEHGADVDAEIEGESLLVHVVGLGNEPATKLLLERGANVHTRNKQGETPLIVAVSTGRGSIVDVLLAHGADVEARDNKGETSLYIAVSQREHLILQALIRHGAIVDSRNLGGSRPLDVAVAKADSAVVRVLLNNGANVSTLSQVGNGQIDPMLHRAIRNSDLATVEILLDAAPPVILTIDHKCNTPLHQAILEGREPHERILDLLLERFHGRTGLFLEGNVDGDTPLHLAVRLNRPKMAESLLAAQSFPDADKNLGMQNLKGERVLDPISSSLSSLTREEQLCSPLGQQIERIQQSLHDKRETIEREHSERVQSHLSTSETAEGILTLTPAARVALEGAEWWLSDCIAAANSWEMAFGSSGTKQF